MLMTSLGAATTLRSGVVPPRIKATVVSKLWESSEPCTSSRVSSTAVPLKVASVIASTRALAADSASRTWASA
jgi:hypothetical protein